MRTMIAILILTISVSVNAKDKPKTKIAPKESVVQEDPPYRDPVPGGARADHHFYTKWRDMIQPAKFPFLPHSSELMKDKEEEKVHSNQRKRYILHLDTSHVDMKNEIWDSGYYHYAYSTKEQGDFLIQVHPQYRICFDNLTKKFDEMQWSVFTNGDLVGRKVIRLEVPRQCLGQLKETGSKLKSATGALE